MAMKNLYNGKGEFIGSTNDLGNVITCYGSKGEYLGYYDKNTKQTLKASGGIIQQNGIEGLGYLIYSNYKNS